LSYLGQQCKWPTKEVYIQRILPKLKVMMISSNYNSIQKRLLNEGLLFVGLRANYLSFLLNKVWKIKENCMICLKLLDGR